MTAANEPDNPKAWLRHARSNLILAETGKQRGVILEDLCFEAQQAAEKALKGVCVLRKVEFPKTHSLVTLTGLLEQANVPIPPEIKEADLLTFFAVQARYPGWDETMTEAEYLHALDIARQVVSWAAKMIREEI